MITFWTENGRFFAERDAGGNARLTIEGELEGSCAVGTTVRFVAKLTQQQLADVVRECAQSRPEGT